MLDRARQRHESRGRRRRGGGDRIGRRQRLQLRAARELAALGDLRLLQQASPLLRDLRAPEDALAERRAHLREGGREARQGGRVVREEDAVVLCCLYVVVDVVCAVCCRAHVYVVVRVVLFICICILMLLVCLLLENAVVQQRLPRDRGAVVHKALVRLLGDLRGFVAGEVRAPPPLRDEIPLARRSLSVLYVVCICMCYYVVLLMFCLWFYCLIVYVVYVLGVLDRPRRRRPRQLRCRSPALRGAPPARHFLQNDSLQALLVVDFNAKVQRN